MDETIILNLGCGDDIREPSEREKWINLDKFSNPGVDIVHDLENPLPLEDESVDMIKASHVFEHIHDLHQLVMECHRVLKPKGTLSVRVPEFPCRAAVADPTHFRYFTPETFYHFTKSKIGFDTFGLRNAFELKWLETIVYSRKPLDDGKPGAYFTEILAELEKPGEPYSWEKPKENADVGRDTAGN